MIGCATYLFAAATQVIIIAHDHSEIMAVQNYKPEQRRGAFVWYCRRLPPASLHLGLAAGKMTIRP